MDTNPDHRWKDIDRQLDELADGKAVQGNPAALEEQLLKERDELEWEAGEENVHKRDSCQ
jgi:hypothetical protein